MKRHKKESAIIYTAISVSVLFTLTLKRKPSMRHWTTLLFTLGLINHGINKFLVGKRYILYPVRLFPKWFKINFVYDYLICPFISVWYAQSTYRQGIWRVLAKSFLFAIPQMILEFWALEKTKLIHYKRSWTKIHTFFAILGVKLIARGVSGLITLAETRSFRTSAANRGGKAAIHPNRQLLKKKTI